MLTHIPYSAASCATRGARSLPEAEALTLVLSDTIIWVIQCICNPQSPPQHLPSKHTHQAGKQCGKGGWGGTPWMVEETEAPTDFLVHPAGKAGLSETGRELLKGRG